MSIAGGCTTVRSYISCVCLDTFRTGPPRGGNTVIRGRNSSSAPPLIPICYEMSRTRGRSQVRNAFTHTHIYIHTYMYICTCYTHVRVRETKRRESRTRTDGMGERAENSGQGFKRAYNDSDLCLGSLSRTLDRDLLENIAAATIRSSAAALVHRTSGRRCSTEETAAAAAERGNVVGRTAQIGEKKTTKKKHHTRSTAAAADFPRVFAKTSHGRA